MKITALYRIPGIRERYAKIRFNYLHRISKLTRDGNILGIRKLDYSESAFIKYSSIRERVNFLVNSVDSAIRVSDQNVLVIGPRYETELFGYQGLGFKKSKITAIDTFTYSRMIQTGNMHDLKFPNEHFDLIVIGWTLVYSTDLELALNEIHRVSKNESKILITFDLESENLPMSFKDIKLFNGEENILLEKIKNFKIFSYSVGPASWSGSKSVAAVILTKIGKDVQNEKNT